jgi:hypothetical protein
MQKANESDSLVDQFVLTDHCSFIRIFIHWAMDRECPNAFLKMDHKHCPFCAEHATARTVENLLKWVHVRASEL